jgi:hypothetical protein
MLGAVDYKQRRSDRARELRGKLPKPVAAWLDEIGKDAAVKARATVAKRDKLVSKINQDAAQKRATLEAARRELDDARANLANPGLATAQEIATWMTIDNHWPARIGDLAEQIRPFDEQIRQAETDCSQTLSSIQTGMVAAVKDVQRILPDCTPSVYDLIG